MNAQKNPLILKTLSLKENLVKAADIIKRNISSNAAKVTRVVCETFGFKDPKGNLQVSSCYKALASLDDRGLIDFPMRQPIAQTFNVRCLPQGVAEPENVPARVEDVTGLRLVLVETDEQRLTLNTILMNEHPLGATRFAGY